MGASTSIVQITMSLWVTQGKWSRVQRMRQGGTALWKLRAITTSTYSIPIEIQLLSRSKSRSFRQDRGRKTTMATFQFKVKPRKGLKVSREFNSLQLHS